MKKKINISPIGLKGNQINERMKQLMGIGSINENKSNIVVELTKVGPDGKAYAIVRENHEWYIKTTDKNKGLVAEDFKYIGGLMNKKSEVYPSYAKAIKHLNLKFKSLAEAHNFEGEINVFENDNLLSESGMAGFSSEGGSGFSGKGNNEGQESLWEEEEEEVELTTEEAAIDKMIDEELVGNQDELDVEPEGGDGDIDSKDLSKLRKDKKDITEAFEKITDKKFKMGDKIKSLKSGKIITVTGIDPDRKIYQVTYDNGEVWSLPFKNEDMYELSNAISEHKLSILKAMDSMDAIIDSLTEGKVKKKVYTLK